MKHLFKILIVSQFFYLFGFYLIAHSSTFLVKKEKELALKEYQSLETTNKHLKAQVRCFSMEEILKLGVTLSLQKK